MTGLTMEQFILFIIIGTLFAIVYALRILVIMERRVARMDENLLKLARQTLREEEKIENLVRSKRKR